MQTSVTKEEVVAVAAVKWIRSLVESYQGKPEQFKEWLLERLDEKNLRGDEILGRAYDNVL